MDGRPVRWADPERLVGDYDGRERTLEVFNADAAEQRPLIRRLRPLRQELESALGGPVVVIFHTTAESARLYREWVEGALRDEAAQDTVVDYELPEDLVPLALDIELHVRPDDAPGSGSAALPRVAA
jgi:hypothetical protein